MKLTRTNNRAKEAGDNGAAHGTLFVADMQVAEKAAEAVSGNHRPEAVSI